MEDSLKSALKKISDTEKDNTRRIEDLEARLGAKVAKEVENTMEGSLSARLANLEERMGAQVGAQVGARLDSELHPKMAELKADAALNSRTWMIPFVLICIALALQSCWGFATWNKIKKTHFL